MSKTGFTLLELLIVIIIIGVLASVAMPRFAETIERSRTAEAIAALGTVKRAAEACFLNNGTYLTCTSGSLGIGMTAGSYFNISTTTNGGRPQAILIEASRTFTEWSYGGAPNSNVVGVKLESSLSGGTVATWYTRGTLYAGLFPLTDQPAW